jgi:hypothetical protein
MIAPQLRILCLHDANSNASLLKEDLDRLGQKLWKKYGSIDLVYVNSPISLVSSSNRDGQNEAGLRVWWETQTHPLEEDHSELSPSYRGLDASLLLLRQIWMSTPFWGIFGVGQGAAVAALLTLLLPTFNESKPIPPPSFCIFLAGVSLLDERERLVDDDFPCLHVVPLSTNDNNEVEHESLIHQFGGSVRHFRRGKDLLDKDVLNDVGRFICEQRKNLFSTQSRHDIVSLQTALALTELQAADTIAQQIALDPPAALMAIIRPQDVAGWSGNKRRQPGEEGGGAPCPPVFVMNKGKRPVDQNNTSSHSGSASRAHPNREEADIEL